MKKAKIVLSAVALMAVVGGAFAFKANRGTNTFYTKATAAPFFCTVKADLNYQTVAVGGTVVNGITTSSTNTTLCSARVITIE